MHTKEPWVVSSQYAECEVRTRDSDMLIATFPPYQRETPRRIVACVNACAGLDTEFLELSRGHEPAAWTGAAIGRLRKHRDELLAALEGMVDMANRYREPGAPIPDAQKTAISVIAKVEGGAIAPPTPATANFPCGSLGEEVDPEGGAA